MVTGLGDQDAVGFDGVHQPMLVGDPPGPEAGQIVAQRLRLAQTGEGFAPGQEIVFIHLRDARGKIVAQDDYRGSALLWGDPALRPVPGECVAETRRIAIPPGTAPGPLDLAVGLYQPKNGRRVKALASEAPAVRRRAAVWPGALRVVSGSP